MPAGLIEIKKKIRATSNTRKITKAMQLVAASKMRFFQKKALSSRAYAWDLLGFLNHHVEDRLESPLAEVRNEGKILFVLYTSDKGLCGALNSRILKTFMESDLWSKTAAEDRLLMTIGRKSQQFALYRGLSVVDSVTGISEKLTLLEAVNLAEKIIQYWLHHNVKQVVMVAPHYKNSLVYYPVVKTYLPFSRKMVHQHIRALEQAEGRWSPSSEESHQEDAEPPMLFEPDRERFLEILLEQLVHTLFSQSFFELKAAEYSSRMIAMQNATDAAGKIIKKQTLRFNKARQAAITQEIAEIVGGSLV